MAPTVRSFSADIEPLRLVARFPGIYPGLLESGAPLGARSHPDGRFDVLPMINGECLRLDSARRLTGPHAAGAPGFLAALEEWWSALREPAPAASAAASALPFTGGWLLYLGYELSAEVETRLALPPSPDPVIAFAMRAPAAWIRDRSTMRAWVVAEAGSEAMLDAFDGHVRESAEPSPATASLRGAHWVVEEEDPARYLAAVSRALDYTAAGDVYQTNLSREWKVRSDRELDPIAIYERLRTTNPGPFAAVLRLGDFSVMSSSPERLLSIRGGMVSTRPIAGTRPRGDSPGADAALVQSLLSNEKERAEHVMLIDLERNDLGRVCVGGSVRVDEFMVLETYAHVHHIVSNVKGRLRPDASPVDVIRALFPGGTITGCPKVRCMEIIAELEGTGRGAYTGSMGYLNRDGSCDLNILIRTLTGHGAAAAGTAPVTFRAGAGIVADSLPLQELAETRAKALGMLRALEPAS